jgi:hypothetical protein
MILKEDRSWQPGQKTKVALNYRVKNWAAYDIALRERGDITVWFDEEDGHRNSLAAESCRRRNKTIERPRRTAKYVPRRGALGSGSAA